MKYLAISLLLVYVSFITYNSDKIHIRMLPMCAWQWMNAYFDQDEWKCKCRWWYERKNWNHWCEVS